MGSCRGIPVAVTITRKTPDGLFPGRKTTGKRYAPARI